MIFPSDMLDLAAQVLQLARARKTMIATAESCTGGLIAACLTEISGSSDVVDRGYVTYSNEAKMDLLGVSQSAIEQFGAVSSQVATAMAIGALERSQARISVAVTGVAGPTGGTTDKPVGLVHLACAQGADTVSLECRFGNIGRDRIRLKTVVEALGMLKSQLS